MGFRVWGVRLRMLLFQLWGWRFESWVIRIGSCEEHGATDRKWLCPSSFTHPEIS